MTEKEKFIILVSNHELEKADAVFLLEGDGYNRIEHAVSLYKNGYAPYIVISPGADNPDYGSFPDLSSKLQEEGIPESAILEEGKAKHTQEESVFMLSLVKKNNWKKVILITSNFHQYRAFLTFLKTAILNELDIKIINSPARDISWFGDNKWGKRFELLPGEFEKIEKYGKLGHIATFEEGIEYHKKNE